MCQYTTRGTSNYLKISHLDSRVEIKNKPTLGIQIEKIFNLKTAI